MFAEDELVPISALQHILYCARQCGLIHIDRVWAENRYTAEGEVLHRNVHQQEVRHLKGVRAEYSVPMRSLELGLVGVADVVEYAAGEAPVPVEFKRGRPKKSLVDVVQLCAQALCLEEMTGAEIELGYLFYGKTRRRERIVFDSALRGSTKETTKRLHGLFVAGVTPRMGYDGKRCDKCSLIEVCQPKIGLRVQRASAFLSRQLHGVMEESGD